MNRLLLLLLLVLATPAFALDHGWSWIEPFASDPTVNGSRHCGSARRR
jgi:hypothetical protein